MSILFPLVNSFMPPIVADFAINTKTSSAFSFAVIYVKFIPSFTNFTLRTPELCVSYQSTLISISFGIMLIVESSLFSTIFAINIITILPTPTLVEIR
jgi:hypothetical protein